MLNWSTYAKSSRTFLLIIFPNLINKSHIVFTTAIVSKDFPGLLPGESVDSNKRMLL